MKHKIHKYCEMFPEITGEEFEALRADIAEHGLREPITRWGSIVVDGKNRLAACEELGMTPEFREWRPSAKSRTGEQQDAELLAWVISKNLHRRHLSESQRGMIAARLVTEKHGGDRKSKDQAANLPLDQGDAAAQLNVSERTVRTAAMVIENAAPEVVKAVESGEVSVSDAAAIADKPKAEQKAAVLAVRKGKAKTLRAATREPGEDPTEPEHRNPSVDALKCEVPESLYPVFDEASRFRGIQNELGKIVTEIEELSKTKAGKRLDFQECQRLAEQLRTNVKFAAPHTECVKCRRKPDKKCDHCKGTGWLTKQEFSACASDADKAWLDKR